MAKRFRDHRAEYARQKAKAQAAEYRSQREYKRARKAAGITRRDPVPPKSSLPERIQSSIVRETDITRMKRESRRWSNKSSWVEHSKFNPDNDWTEDQIRRYHQAYLVPIPKGLSRREKKAWKLDQMHDFLVPDFMTEEQWKQLYLGE